MINIQQEDINIKTFKIHYNLFNQELTSSKYINKSLTLHEHCLDDPSFLRGLEIRSRALKSFPFCIMEDAGFPEVAAAFLSLVCLV